MKDKQMTKTIKGIAAPLPLANVDTDVIMPKRFLITITREGLGDGTFADLRFDNAGQQRPEFILNKRLGRRPDFGRRRQFRLWVKPGTCRLGHAPAWDRCLHRYRVCRNILRQCPQKRSGAAGCIPSMRGTHFCNLPAMPAVTRYRLILKGAGSQLLILRTIRDGRCHSSGADPRSR